MNGIFIDSCILLDLFTDDPVWADWSEKVFIRYKKNKGIKKSPLPDFFIGAHATVSQFDLITRDSAKYKTYFPSLNLIHPDNKMAPNGDKL